MTSTQDDIALVEAALSGQPQSRRRLARRLAGAIQREVAIALLRPASTQGRDPRQDVQDLVQEVLVALFEHDARELRRWDPARGRGLESFVRLVARRRVARTLSQRRGNPWSASQAEYHEEPDDQMVERLRHRARLSELLEHLQAKMGPRDVELFDLLFVQELDPEEVSERMEMSRGAVNAWSYRTRKQAKAIAQQLVVAAKEHAPARAGEGRTR